MISKGLSSPTSGLSEGLVGAPASISPPLKEGQELLLALLPGNSQTERGVGGPGQKGPAEELVPSSCLCHC